MLQHPLALVHADNLCLGIGLGEDFKKTAMAFTEEEDGLSVLAMLEVRDAGLLQLVPGQEPFQGTVIRSKAIKAHGAEVMRNGRTGASGTDADARK